MNTNAQKLKTTLAAVIAIIACAGLITLAAWMRVGAHIGDAAFVSCVGFGIILGFCIYRGHDVTELAFAKSASVKLAKAEEISDGVAELAEQMVILFEPKEIEPSEKFDEVAHDAFMKETIGKIKRLTRRYRHDHSCHGSCSEQHAPRQLRSCLTLNVRQK